MVLIVVVFGKIKLSMVKKLLFILTIMVSFPNQVVRAKTTETICTLPSLTTVTETEYGFAKLWWGREQFDPFNGQLIQGWVINTENNSIDLVINRQLWTLLDYINRYRLVNHMGAIAREYQYNLRLINQQEKCLAFYTCDFTSDPHDCKIDFDIREINSLELDE